MALSAATGLAAYSIADAVKKLDLSEELSEVIRSDNVSLINRIGVGGMVATQEKHSWVEDELNPNTATVTEGAEFSDSDETLTVGTDEGARFKIGTIFKFNERNKTELCRVTAIDGDNLTVVRGYGSTSGETHADGTTIMIVSHTKAEGWKPTQEDWTQERTGPYNYLTTTGYGITISRRRQAVDHAAIPSEFAHQSAYRLKEYMRQLDSAVINSIRSASSGSSTDYSSFGGLIEFTSQSGGNTNSTAETLSPSVVNAMLKQIWDDGGMVAGGRLAMIVGGVQKRKISTFDQAYRRSDFDTKVAGYVVDKFISDLGFEIEIIVDPWMPDDTVIIGDLNRVKIGPLQTDAVGLEDIAKTGRVIEAMLSGTYTMEVRNAVEAFAIHTNLSS
ncbi:MAG: SU10 major capsid protein [Candidatus Heimdallarchaeaceae archaeon]